ncbi:MAG TPA: hypothetical protein DEB17_03440 [Chlorobaculum sp.]|uniref:Uncharacterized protein n=1 Tax=Chlorobaculum tepidum (strain ATCC 49652 / DSM 12025 / NBRC 103806 / TLS) TaxID=194439 RepID=Q8KDP7_CHLTE|nr:hypothetical protein CT0998 [Chlorobaculum tepidum TLS]HBU23038.1 hypothetical protein [Chlorobaculum sp.]
MVIVKLICSGFPYQRLSTMAHNDFIVQKTTIKKANTATALRLYDGF